MNTAEVTRNVLIYFILPLWLAAGFADYLCHRAAYIERTSGVKESLLHLLQFAEIAVPILAALFLEINALIILIMIVRFFVHEATAFWDVSYASQMREISPIEQHVHSFLEMLPLMGLLMVIVLHWDQFLPAVWIGSRKLCDRVEAAAAAVDLHRHNAHDGAAVRSAAVSGGIDADAAGTAEDCVIAISRA